MAVVNSISWLIYFLLLVSHHSSARRKDKIDLELLTLYRNFIDNKLSSEPCTEDYNLLGTGNILQDYSFWDKEIRIVNNVANYITSMWRYKDARNRSLVENVATMYTLAKTVALSSQQIYGSVVCFDMFKFQGRRQFCPYAFTNVTQKNRTIVRDLGSYDYLTTPSPSRNGSSEKQRHTFVWWHVGKKYLANATLQLEENNVFYDTNLDNPASNAVNASQNGRYFNITASQVPINHGKWTTPYYDCFGGKTWMFTYLAPFYDEANGFL